MSITERFTEYPAAAISGCVVWIFIAIWVYFLVMWMIQGDVDALTGVIGIGVGISLGYFTMVPPRQELAPWFAIAAATVVFVFPVVRYALQRRELAQMDVELIEQAYANLGVRPKNAAMRFRLARTLYDRGMVHAAIAIAEPAVKELPVRHYPEEHRAVVGWRQYAKGVAPASYSCPSCEYQNKPGEVFCQGCGTPLFLPRVTGQVGRDFARKMITVWACLLLLALGIPVASTTLNPVAGPVVILLLLGVAFAVCLITFRPREQAA